MTQTQTNNGEVLQTFVSYKSVIVERVGRNFYLSANGETLAISEDSVKELLYELDINGGNTPLTAANYIMAVKDRFKQLNHISHTHKN